MSFHKSCFEQRPKDFARSEEYAKFHVAIEILLDKFDHIANNVIVISFLREAYRHEGYIGDFESKIRVAIVHFYKAQGYTDKEIDKILYDDDTTPI